MPFSSRSSSSCLQLVAAAVLLGLLLHTLRLSKQRVHSKWALLVHVLTHPAAASSSSSIVGVAVVCTLRPRAARVE